jgi:hypothetical protein
MENDISKMTFQVCIVGLATMAWVPKDRKEKAWPLGMLTVGWGILSSTWCALPKSRFVEPLSKLPNPLQKQRNPTQKHTAQSVPTDCALKQQKLGGENKKCWKTWVFG